MWLIDTWFPWNERYLIYLFKVILYLNFTDSQKHPPIITFGKPDVVVGGLLRANCTSAPAAPAPKLIWYIDNEKVILNPIVT